MSGHDGGEAQVDVAAERQQVYAVHLGRCAADQGQQVVGVGAREAMAGEVLGYRYKAGVLYAPGVGYPHAGDVLRVRAQGAAEHDSAGPGGHVKHRPEYHVEPYGGALGGYAVAVGVHPLLVDVGQEPVLGVDGGTGEPHAQAPLGVDGQKHGYAGNLLQRVGYQSHGEGVALEEDHAAHLVVGHVFGHQAHGGLVGTREGGGHE